jgi:SPP1 gp7 family putative phage head morphogenesis protein
MLAWFKKLPPIFNADDSVPDLFGESEIEHYILSIFQGIITKNNLSVDYHYRIAAYLEKAIIDGFNDISAADFTPKRWEILQGLRKSIYVFSAAKQYSQVREMSAFIDAGVGSTFKEFRQLADKVFETYNKTYLKVEYTTAVGQAEMARQWAQIQDQKKVLTKLTYHTQQDARVRDEHAVLNGITRPVDDKFWDNYMPKNAWRCRCFVTQETEEVPETDLSKREIPEFGDKEFPKVFRMNPGKDMLVFNPKFHPYFRVARGDADFRANNFGLPATP